MLVPLGLGKDSLHPGERVTVHANPNKHGAGHVVLGREVVTDDGRTLPLFIASHSVTKPSKALADGLAGTWFAPRQGFFAFNASRRDWSLTDAGPQGARGNSTFARRRTRSAFRSPRRRSWSIP